MDKKYIPETVTFDDEPGVIYDVISIFPVNIDNTGDRDYIAILPRGAGEDEDILLYRADTTDPDDIKITEIEDDDEYDIVADAFDEILDEEEFYALAEDLEDEEEEEEEDEDI